MSKKICSCGTCESAMRRAIALFKAMDADGECPILMHAVGAALQSVAFNIVAGDIAGGAPNVGLPEEVVRMLVASQVRNRMDEITYKVEDEAAENPHIYTPLINEVLEAHNERVTKLQDLPKDT